MKAGKTVVNNIMACCSYSFLFPQSRRSINFSAPLLKLASVTSMKIMERKQRKLMAKMEAKAIEREAYRKPNTHLMASLAKDKLDSSPWSANYLREHEPRRVKMVESLLLDRITELLADERFSDFLVETSIEITGVQINRFNGQLNVLWAPTGDAERDQKVQRILQSMTPDLREHLCNQHILGFVPRIEFVRDKTTVCLKELQDRLTSIDIGPPDEIASTPEREVLEVTVEGNPDSGLRSSLSGAMVDPLGLDRAPELRTDIGGIDRTKFLEELQNSRKRNVRNAET